MLAQVAIQELERQAIDEDDPAKANAFKYDARGARKFWETLTQRVEYIQQTTEKMEDPREEFYAIIPEGNNGTTASS